MNYRQKLGYTLLGAVIMLTGMTIDSILAPPSVAQQNGVFNEIQCSKLTVVSQTGKPAIILSSDPTDGSTITLTDHTGIPRLGILAKTDGGFIQLNSHTEPSISIGASKVGAFLAIENGRGTKLFDLTVADFMRHLALHKPDGKLAIALASIGDSASDTTSVIQIYDNPDQPVWRAP